MQGVAFRPRKGDVAFEWTYDIFLFVRAGLIYSHSAISWGKLAPFNTIRQKI